MSFFNSISKKDYSNSNSRFVFMVCLFFYLVCAFEAIASDRFSCDLNGNIESRLTCVSGLSFAENTTVERPDGYRIFDLKIEQLVDHTNLKGERFNQRLVLYHRNYSNPMILQTSGYGIFNRALTGVAQKFAANQIQVEHRFFGESVPKILNWDFLNIEQSADDFHEITQSLKKIYNGKWLNTGASKGGMTSVFHRRFYPEDLDGTLALVAPLSYSRVDERYIDFVEKVGGRDFSDCRKRLEQFQKTVLKNKSNILKRIVGRYQTLGSADIALEHAVFELPFAFWQYGSPGSTTTGCEAIPRANASADTVYSFLDQINGVESSYSDEGMKKFVPYYVQAANELGSPAAKTAHLVGIAQQIDTYRIESYIPVEALKDFDSTKMPEIQEWVKATGDRIMFIYGEFDPWSAGAFQIENQSRENFIYVAPNGNHGSNINSLRQLDREAAWSTLGRWLNSKISENENRFGFKKTSKDMKTLEELDFESMKKAKTLF